MPRNRRPTSILVMAIINIVFGAFTLICGICAGGSVAVLAAFSSQPPGGVPNPALEIPKLMDQEIPGWQTIEIGRSLLLLLLGVILIVAGIGLLKMQVWARWLCVLYAVLSTFLTISYLIFQLAFALPAMDRVNAKIEKQQPPGVVVAKPPGQSAGESIGSRFGAVAGAVISLAMALANVVVMLLPPVGAAFAPPRRRRSRDDENDEDDLYDDDGDERRRRLRDRDRDDEDDNRFRRRPRGRDYDDYD
jgi:hypothetical protein